MSADHVFAANILAEDPARISYRPKLNEITGGVLSTIMFGQVLYWARAVEKDTPGKPFYKFFAPCSHSDYREGDSWEEELGFSRNEVQHALSGFAKKITKGVSKHEEYDRNLVIYWTDKTRKTWYQVNWMLVEEALKSFYLCNVENLHYIENEENLHYINKPDSSITSISQPTTQRTTTMSTDSRATPDHELEIDNSHEPAPTKKRRTPQQDLADQLYLGLKETYNIRLKREQMSFHIDHFRQMLERDDPSDEETNAVVEYMVERFKTWKKVNAVEALQDVRTGKHDGSAWSGPAPWEQEGAREKSYYEKKYANSESAEETHRKLREEIGLDSQWNKIL